MPQDKQLHLAIIPDGNRRWAKESKQKPWEGHDKGMEVVYNLIDWAYDNEEVGVLTLWGFSTSNWNRSTFEVDKLMKIYEEWLIKERPRLHEKKIKLLHSGRMDRIPKSLAKLIEETMEETKDYSGFVLHFALDYGGRDELIRAISKMKEEDQVTEETLHQYLDQPQLPDIDLIIRTSGEQRLSNFFLWQAADAELYFIDKYFPALEVEDLDQAIEDFLARHRRFGS